MRLRILDSGRGFGTKLLFALIRTASRQPVLDVINLVKCRGDFYGGLMSGVTREAMRGPSAWSVLHEAHGAVAQLGYRDEQKVACYPLSRPRPYRPHPSRSHCGRRC